jgi:type I restriction enzyme S subunit
VEGLHVGTLIPHLKKQDLPNLRIPLPPLPVQQSIGALYCDLSRKIEHNRRMNRTLEAMAAALFKSWFVDFDPVTAKAEGRQPYGMTAENADLFPDSFQESVIGSLPHGWKLDSIYEVALLCPRRSETFGA